MTFTVLDAMNDAEAFGPWFEGDSWGAWKACSGCLLPAAVA